MARKETDEQTEKEKDVSCKAAQEEGEESQSPKRKTIRQTDRRSDSNDVQCNEEVATT